MVLNVMHKLYIIYNIVPMSPAPLPRQCVETLKQYFNPTKDKIKYMII